MADIGMPGFSRTKKFDSEARLARIQDAKSRTIGLDTEALATQVEEKAAMKAAESGLHTHYEGMAQYFDQKLTMMEQEKLEIQRQMNKDLVAYRANMQQKSGTTEFDLNDPEFLKKSIPARVGDDDERASLSGMQFFDGEDLAAGERKKLQQQQQAVWCKQQADEKAAKKAFELRSEDEYVALLRAQEGVQNDVASALAGARSAAKMQSATDNIEMAKDQAAMKAAMKAGEIAANVAEQQYIMGELHMIEHPVLEVNMMQPHRVRPDHYKGMKTDEVDYILASRAAQREELAEKKAAEKQAEWDYSVMQNNITKTLEMKTQAVEQFKADQRKAVQATLMKQNAEKAERDATLAATYTNVPTADFFGQFGTSAR